METVLITGGSGMIGTAVIRLLRSEDVEIRTLSRSKQELPGTKVFTWDVQAGQIDPDALKDVDHIIHLAGATVSERWTENQKRKIRDSRIKSANLLFEKLEDQKIKSFISASGSSIYGTQTSEHIFNESDTPDTYDDDFLAKVSVDWEKAADQFGAKADRVVKMRTPVVMSATGGALERIAKPVKMGVGAALGSGDQYVPWVHIEDMAAAYIFALKNEKMSGAYNVVAPEHVTNEQLTKTIGLVLDKSIWMPNVPAFALRALYGDMAEIILKGSRLDGQKITELGYNYKFKELEPALLDLLKG